MPSNAGMTHRSADSRRQAVVFRARREPAHMAGRGTPPQSAMPPASAWRAAPASAPSCSFSSAHSNSESVGASSRRRCFGSPGSSAMHSAHENSDRCGSPWSPSAVRARYDRSDLRHHRLRRSPLGVDEQRLGIRRNLLSLSEHRLDRVGIVLSRDDLPRQGEHQLDGLVDIRPRPLAKDDGVPGHPWAASRPRSRSRPK